MSYTLTLYNFNKRKNSTKTPTSDGTSIDVVLKEGCSIQSPTVLLNGYHLNAFATQYNYFKLFDKYYFLTNATAVNNNMIEISGHIDVLGTYATAIGNYRCQIARSSDSSLINNRIVDNMVQATSEMATSRVIVGNWGGREFSVINTSVTASIFGDDGFMLINSISTPKGFISQIFDDTSWWNNFVVGDQSPEQYCQDVIMLPLQFDSSNYGSITDDVGALAMDVTHGYDITNSNSRVITRSVDFDLTGYHITNATSSSLNHWDFDDFRNFSSNFVNVTLKAPFIGNINIDPKFLEYDTITVTYYVDMGTGDGVAKITATSNDTSISAFPISMQGIQVGVPIRFSASTRNSGLGMSIISDVAGIGASAVQSFTNPVAGATGMLSGAANAGIGLAMADAGGMWNYSTQGSLGSFANWEDFSANLYINARKSTHRSYDQEYGRPVLKGVTQISSIAQGSFVQCVAPSIDTMNNALESDIIEVNNYLANGFYKE